MNEIQDNKNAESEIKIDNKINNNNNINNSLTNQKNCEDKTENLNIKQTFLVAKTPDIKMRSKTNKNLNNPYSKNDQNKINQLTAKAR